jgi:hypothetical protein
MIAIDDDKVCINCEREQPAGVRWRRLMLVAVDSQGVMDDLEEWLVCPDCDSAKGGVLVQYARFALA